jgi:dihydropteroate synthase
MRLRLGQAVLPLQQRTAVMGIVNRTPDSFYAGGRAWKWETALRAAAAHLQAGAALIDVGGVKAGPGPAVDAAEEQARVVPLVAAIRERLDAPVSVETSRVDVAAAALEAGAAMINDVTGLSDPEIADAVAEHPGAALVVMHAGGQRRGRPFRPSYHPDTTTAVAAELERLAGVAAQRGVPAGQIVIDPGHDFGKNTYQSLELTRRLPELAALGHPLLVALSRKDFLGETLGDDVAPTERLEASLAAAAVATHHGAHLLRVHDTAATVRVVRTVEAIAGRRPPAAAVRGLV